MHSHRATINKIPLPSVGADHALEQIDPGIRIGHSTVTLSAAKQLAAQAAQGDTVRHLRLMPITADVSAHGGFPTIPIQDRERQL